MEALALIYLVLVALGVGFGVIVGLTARRAGWRPAVLGWPILVLVFGSWLALGAFVAIGVFLLVLLGWPIGGVIAERVAAR